MNDYTETLEMTAHCVLKPQVLEHAVIAEGDYSGMYIVKTKDGTAVGLYSAQDFEKLYEVVRPSEGSTGC